MRKAPAETETVAERDARFWDNFYSVKQSLRKFESDADDHRKLRAVEAFNAGTQVGKDIKVLRPTLQSACPHVLTNIVPRQMVEMGDPLRRGCDQSESIGANMKSTIHRRVARNNIDGKARKHTRHGSDGAVQKTWQQKALRKSRVLQAFRAECVSERVTRDPRYADLLQRKHHRLLDKGRVSKAPVKAEGKETSSIGPAYKRRVRELREEGGEPPEAA